MFYFKNKYESSRNKERKPIPGLSKYWRYSTLDSQNNNYLYTNTNLPTIPNINNNENNKSPNDITIEVSYDNFYVLGVDMMKKKKYAEELKAQIEQKRYLKKLEEEKRKLDEIKDDLRIEKERKEIEERENQSNNKYIPKINLRPLPKIEPVKVSTPKISIPTKMVTKYKIYKKKSSEDEINNYLRKREMNLERFNNDLNEQLNGIKNDFNSGIKKLNDEIHKINFETLDKNKKIDELIYNIKKPCSYKKNNFEIEHIYSIIRKKKDGKFTIQQFMNNSEILKNPLDIRLFNNSSYNNNCKEKTSDVFNLPYINLSHQIVQY